MTSSKRHALINRRYNFHFYRGETELRQSDTAYSEGTMAQVQTKTSKGAEK